jgi:hypothetical protein
MRIEFCGCVTNEKSELGQRFQDIWDEAVELTEVKSWDEYLDEWSDVVFGVGRLLGYFWGVKYVSLWGDQKHVDKIKRRLVEYGCVRSKRHLVDGKCCSVCK